MGYDNILFSGKSMRNAIITKLSEDKHLTSALFANSNITILIDILSYMYQCLMSNLRQAASESMWSDTIFFENAARLAKMIGYYAKGQIPFTILAKVTDKTLDVPEMGKVQLGYGPYEYNFAVVEHNVNSDETLIRLALGQWNAPLVFTSDGSKYQEFVIQRDIGNYDKPSFISQKYMRVFSKFGDDVAVEWKYSPDPLFLVQNPEYTDLDAENPGLSRTKIANQPSKYSDTRYYNFYIDENGDYILKFGDGISTSIPESGSKIYVYYVSSTETEDSVSDAMKSAIVNANASVISPSDNTIFEILGMDAPKQLPSCLPVTPLSGYRDKDDAESIRINSRNSFSRQNRLVTKEDYKTFLLENFSEWKDIAVQNNWEYISSFYGWLYAIKPDCIDPNKLQSYNSSDLADANNVYIWVLTRDAAEKDQVDGSDDRYGIMIDTTTGLQSYSMNISLGAIKDITEHPVFLFAICKRFIPYAGDKPPISNELTGLKTTINYSSPNPFDPNRYKTCFRIHVDSNYANTLNIIKSKTYSLIRTYLFDDVKLGKTPNIPALIKDIMGIEGVINITTVYNEKKEEDAEFNDALEMEVNGMKFCTWSDMDPALLTASDDVRITYNLPNIPCFQYFKAAQTYEDFLNYSIEFKVDYSIKS